MAGVKKPARSTPPCKIQLRISISEDTEVLPIPSHPAALVCGPYRSDVTATALFTHPLHMPRTVPQGYIVGVF